MKAIQFRLGENILSAQIGARIEKKHLYGYSRKVAEKDGKLIERGFLSADGRLLRRSQTTAFALTRNDRRWKT